MMNELPHAVRRQAPSGRWMKVFSGASISLVFRRRGGNVAMLRHAGLALLALVIGALTMSPANAREIRSETLEWPPHIGSNLPEQGLIPALTKAAFEAAGDSLKIDFVPWNRALKNVLEGRADVVVGAYYSKQRAQDYIVSDVIYHVKVGFIARPGLSITKFETLQDLVPYRIGVVRGYANSEAFDSADFLNKQVTSAPELNIRKLSRNRLDLVVMGFDRFLYEAKMEGVCTDKVVFLEPPLENNGLHILVSRAIPDSEEIVAHFNRGLKIIRENGTFDRIVKRLRG